MRESILWEMNLGTACLDDLVVLGSLPWDNQVAGHVGEQDDGVIELLVVSFCLGEEFGGPGLHGRDFLLHFLSFIPLAFLHQAADLGGKLLLA